MAQLAQPSHGETPFRCKIWTVVSIYFFIQCLSWIFNVDSISKSCSGIKTLSPSPLLPFLACYKLSQVAMMTFYFNFCHIEFNFLSGLWDCWKSLWILRYRRLCIEDRKTYFPFVHIIVYQNSDSRKSYFHSFGGFIFFL